MIPEPDYYTEAKALVATGKYPHVIAADIIAVCMNESHGQPTFSSYDPLYRINLNDAVHVTKLPVGMLKDALSIKGGPWHGKAAKFRLEPGYWEWALQQQLDTPSEKFLCACSIGIAQQMMRWILPAGEGNWSSFINDFMGSLSLQMAYLAGNLEKLLIEANGDLLKAYKAYNSGDMNSSDPAVIARANRVIAYRSQVQKEL